MPLYISPKHDNSILNTSIIIILYGLIKIIYPKISLLLLTHTISDNNTKIITL